MRCAIYARAATRPECEKQLAELRGYVARRGWDTVGEYVDIGSSRPQLARLMADAKSEAMDYVLVWRLDRWGRSLEGCLRSIEELSRRRVCWLAVEQSIDSASMTPFLEALRAFAAEKKRERIKTGMRRATYHGAEIGRPRRIFDRGQVAELREAGMSVRAIAKKLGVGRGTVQRLLSGPKGS